MKNARTVWIGLGSMWLLGAMSASAQEAIPLEQAVREGAVDVTVRALGGSTGDTLLLDVRRKAPQLVRIRLTPGTVFKSTSGSVQDMVGADIQGERVNDMMYRPSDEIVLADGAQHAYIVRAYCLDFDKDNPEKGDRYTIMASDARSQAICDAGRHKGCSPRAIQAAIWLDREELSVSRVQARFAVSDAEIAVARELLQASQKVTQPAETERQRQTAAPSVPPPKEIPAPPASSKVGGLTSCEMAAAAL